MATAFALVILPRRGRLRGMQRFSYFGLAFVCLACGTKEPQTPAESSATPTPSSSTGGTPSVSPGASPTPTTPATETKTLFVHESQVDCEGVQPMKCMQVRESEDDEWTYFYERIIGFEYEEGYRYELRVEVEHLPNPPADKSSLRYRLVEVVSKEKAEEP